MSSDGSSDTGRLFDDPSDAKMAQNLGWYNSMPQNWRRGSM
jgi:hypothetical protein